MGHTSKSSAALAAMAKGDPDAPVVMLNMLRYREQAATGAGVDGMTGRQAYEAYGRLFAELAPRFGGTPVWMGAGMNSIIGDDSWDVVILVSYPARRKFLSMMTDPDYLAIAPMRAAALADSRLIEMRQLLPKP